MKRSTAPERDGELPPRRATSRSTRSAATTTGPALWGHQRRLALFGTMAILGLGLVGASDSVTGMTLVLVGLLGFIVALHRFGRLGKDRGHQR